MLILGGGVIFSQQHNENKEEEKLKSNEIKETIDGIPIRKVYITNIALEVCDNDIIIVIPFQFCFENIL